MRHQLPLRPRPGFALPAALFAMIVIGAIVTGGFYVSSQENSVSVNSDLAAQALNVAEYGLETALGEWSGGTLVDRAGEPPLIREAWIGNRQLGTYRLTVRHLGDRIYMIESEGTATRGPQTSTRRAGSFVRTAGFVPRRSAMTALGEVTVSGNAVVTGEDNCTSDVVPGVVAKDEAKIDDVGGKQHIFGSPAPVVEDPDMNAQTVSIFGDVSVDLLIAQAEKVFAHNELAKFMAPTAAGGECVTSLKLNWGSPDGTVPACADYYPIIYAEGDLLMEVGIGQGILIVEGDLTIKGNTEFAGVIIVKGSLDMQGTGIKILGSVVLLSGDEAMVDDGSIFEGNATVQWDSCKVRNAFERNLRIRPFGSRSRVFDAGSLAAAGA